MRRQAKLEFRLLTGGALLLALAVAGCKAGNADLQRTEPGPDGEMAFVGVEYIVPIEEWEGEELPMLFGETSVLGAAAGCVPGDRPETPALATAGTLEPGAGGPLDHARWGLTGTSLVTANRSCLYTKSPRLSLKLL